MRGAAERMAVTVQEFEAKAARREAAIMGRTIDPAEHQAAVKTLLEGLRREAAQVEAARQALEKTPEALTAAVANAATTGVANGAATVQAAASGMVSAAQAVQAELQRMLTWWTAWTAGISAIIVIAAVGLVWGQTAWARHQLDDLQSQKAAVQADVLQLQAQQTDLERRGRRLIWHTCGRDPCLEVSPAIRGPGVSEACASPFRLRPEVISPPRPLRSPLEPPDGFVGPGAPPHGLACRSGRLHTPDWLHRGGNPGAGAGLDYLAKETGGRGGDCASSSFPSLPALCSTRRRPSILSGRPASRRLRVSRRAQPWSPVGPERSGGRRRR